MNKLIPCILFILLCFLGCSPKFKNYLQIEKTVALQNKDYNLVWSSHPNENYYKQEYLPQNQSVDNYRSMLLIEFIRGDLFVEDAVRVKIHELEIAKKTNPIVNYNVFEKEDEVIIDFLSSANSQDGKNLKMVERNVYRYVNINTKKGPGVLLFAVSERSYGNEINEFFEELKKNKSTLINAVGNFEIPKINPGRIM